MLPVWQALSLLLLAPAYISASTFDCDGELDGGHKFRAKPLAGPRQIHFQENNGVSIHNTTFTIDICDPLKPNGDPAEEQCPSGTRICGVERLWHNGTSQLEAVKPIAGMYTHEGMFLDSKIEWIEGGSSHADDDRAGFRVTLQGGKYPFKDKSGRPQKAIIEFLCNETLTGLEGFEDKEDRRRDDDEDNKDELPDLDAGKSLQFLSYKPKDDFDVLRLTWQTKYACAGAPEDAAPPSKSAGWGFFTWFVIVVFLLAASYIIFGSWLNYNRYGARGWDLIPHGDTIRDLPYILKDFASNLMSRIRGEGSRGGYSAV